MGGNRTYFFYSDEGLVAEFDATGAEIRSYGYEPDSQWTTNPVFQRVGGTYYWYRNDHQGAPQKIVDTTGRVVWAETYDSFGNVQITTEDITNNLRFSGQYYDGETGLYYNLNRYYDPESGRYLRTDPFGDGLNLYAYVFGNPLNLIDPEGLCAVNKGWNAWKDFWTTDPYNSIPEALNRTGDYWGEKWDFSKNWISKKKIETVSKLDKIIMNTPIDSIGINAGGGAAFTPYKILGYNVGVKGSLSTAILIDTDGNIDIIATRDLGLSVVADNYKFSGNMFVNAVIGLRGAKGKHYRKPGLSVPGQIHRISFSATIPLEDNPKKDKIFLELGYVPRPSSFGTSLEAGITKSTGGEGPTFKNPLASHGRWWGNFLYDVLH